MLGGFNTLSRFIAVNRSRIKVISLNSRTTTSCHHQLQHLLLNPTSPIFVRFISNTITSNPQNHTHFTVDYLINSCGLSPDVALRCSQTLVLKSTTKPDSVLSLFQAYGFTKPQISKVIAALPSLLLSKPDKILKPKLDFFASIGIAELGILVCRDPKVLQISLERKLIPFVDFLKGCVCTNDKVVTILQRLRWKGPAILTFVPNVKILQDVGVPSSNISKFLMRNPHSLSMNPDQLKQKVLEVKNIGICPSSMMFLQGLHTLVCQKKHSWDARMEVYQSFGWSEAEVLSVFKKQPIVMGCSVKKIRLALDFFMNSLKWTQVDLANNPTLITLSLEKRVIPRCGVLQILRSKHLISRGGMCRALRVAEDAFLEDYVNKYLDDLPDLMEVYKSKMGAQGLL